MLEGVPVHTDVHGQPDGLLAHSVHQQKLSRLDFIFVISVDAPSPAVLRSGRSGLGENHSGGGQRLTHGGRRGNPSEGGSDGQGRAGTGGRAAGTVTRVLDSGCNSDSFNSGTVAWSVSAIWVTRRIDCLKSPTSRTVFV